MNNADPSPGSVPNDYSHKVSSFDQSQSPLNFGDFTLKGNTLTLTGSGPMTLYVEGDFNLSGGAHLVKSPGINLTIYVKGDFTLSGGSVFNEDGLPPNLTVYCSQSSGKVTLSGDSNFYGTIYAPFSDITISGGSEFYGALWGKTITQSSGSGAFHFDEALLGGGGGAGSGSDVNIAYWRRNFN